MTVHHVNVVAIDLGTTYSSIGRIDHRGHIQIFQESIGSCTQWIPSVVSFPPDDDDPNKLGEVKVGYLALQDERNYPKDVIFDAKRMLGRQYKNKIIQKLSKKWLFKIKPAMDGSILVLTSHGYKTPVEIITEIIKYLLSIAEDYSGNNPITHAVISIPANYNTRQRDETKRAALKAGLKKVHLIGEPTAGIISYWFSDYTVHSNLESMKKVLTFDFGGGTLDLSLAEVTKDKIDIVAVTGKMSLGGRDIDNNLVDYYLKAKNITKLEEDSKQNDSTGELARYYLRSIKNECERVKLDLSSVKSSTINPDINFTNYHVDNKKLKITKELFVSINDSVIRNLMTPVDEIFKEAEKKGKNITKENINDIILIGGSSNNSFVLSNLLEYFKIGPIKNDTRNAVVKGAAIYAKRKFCQNKKFKELEVLSCIETCPLSLGVSLIGKKFDVIIPRNSAIPISNVRCYETTKNYVTHTKHYIHETERAIATNDSYLGTLEQNIPKEQAGVVQMKVKLSLDEDGILMASAWVDNDSNEYYKSEKIIRDHAPKYSQADLKKKIIDADDERLNDIQLVTQNILQTSWSNLHQNVLSFIKDVRCSVKDQQIKESLKKIEKTAFKHKKDQIWEDWEYDYMVRKYIRKFQPYNDSVSPNQQTKFLKFFKNIKH